MVSKMIRRSRWIPACCLVVALLGFSDKAAQGEYILSVVAKTGDVIDGRTLGILGGQLDVNNLGKVAFASTYSGEGGGTGIFTQDGFVVASGTVIDGVPAFFTTNIATPSINDAGVVAFGTRQGSGGSAVDRVFMQDELIAQPGTTIGTDTLDAVSYVSTINNAGTVAFFARVGGLPAIATQNAIIKRFGDDIAPNDPLDNRTFIGVSGPAIGNNGDIAFLGRIATNPQWGIFTQGGPLIFRTDPVGDTTINSFGGRPSQPNASGTVAFNARRPGNKAIVATTSGQKIAEVGQVIDGVSIHSLNSAHIPAIDDNGTVAFIATTFGTGNVVFTQSELVTDGDTPVGGVTDFNPGAVAMNDIGQIAIRVNYTGGSAILLATVPEPSTFFVCSFLGALGITVGWWRRKRAR